MEDFDDGLGPGALEAYEDQSWEVAEDWAKIEDHETLEALENPFANVAQGTPTTDSVTNFSVDIPASTLSVPRHLYHGEQELPAPPEREWTAVQRLLEEHQRLNHANSDNDYIEFALDQFAVYIDPYTPGISREFNEMPYPNELRPLQHLSIRPHCTEMYVDGVVSFGQARYFIRRVPFKELPIGNYGVSEPTVGSELWIRSSMNAKVAVRRHDQDVYYRLKNPSPEYRRYYEPFLWIVDLAKHVIDYLSVAVEESRHVAFRDFRSNFSKWLAKEHEDQEEYIRWRKTYSSSDFCAAIIANVDFIYKEACGISEHRLDSLYLWKEILHCTAYSNSKKGCSTATSALSTLMSAPSSPSPTPSHLKQIPKTVVTPYTYQLFNHLPCGTMMEATSPSPIADRLRSDITRAYDMESCPNIHNSAQRIDGRKPDKKIQIGDVISILRDEDDCTKWAREDAAEDAAVDPWFGLVQKIHLSRNGERSFDVIWFYQPIDTLCGKQVYPWKNELFLSDHCSCHDKEHSKIKEQDVIALHSVDWKGSSTTTANFFCRLTYLHQERQWVTFQTSHLRCSHRQNSPNKFPYEVGDTLLVRLKKDDVVEPCEFIAFSDHTETAIFRQLHRRQRVQPHANAPPNELVYNNEGEMLCLHLGRIHGRCLVRFFQPSEPLPPPYDRRGVGNAFFITHCLKLGKVVPMDEAPASFRQGFDPSKEHPKLRGVDLFCGGGNFGRGLEEGGAIKMKWANDINNLAVHTYMANVADDVQSFSGSIDDMQRLALEGKFSDNVPRIGMVDFVSGGSPCPGFSRLTLDKSTPEQRKNQSLVAAFASFIDTYRPKFGLLENVVEIIQSHKQREEDVFCQLICALVGLGYQTHFFLLDAWAYGSPQTRSRVFLCFAAPGLKLPELPLQSHSPHRAKLPMKALGRLPNGEPMVERLIMPTAFKFVSAAEATADLPDVMDGKADCCISFPDHRLACGVTKYVRSQLNVIPMHPYGMNFRTTWKNGQGIMTKAERQCFPEKGTRVDSSVSRAWGRAHPHKVIQTITTTPALSDARIGKILHWNQNRPFTVLEARRAQGFRDHEVILGQPKDQWKVVGNSVAREVSLALGLSFREAWLGSLVDGNEVIPTVSTPPESSIEIAPEDTSEATQLDTPPSAGSANSRSPSCPETEVSRPSSGAASSAKRRLGSSLVVELLVSKLPKTSHDQTTSGVMTAKSKLLNRDWAHTTSGFVE